MGRVVVVNHVTLDGVMQGPARPDEDTRDGFERGGWAMPGNDEIMGAKVGPEFCRFVIPQEFEQLPPTVGRALTTLSTEWTRYIGEVDKANGVSRTQVSLALHGRRTDARSAAIRASLLKLIGGSR